MKVLECPLLRKRDFRLYGYNFDKYEGWTCPSTSLDLKLDIWTYDFKFGKIKVLERPLSRKFDFGIYAYKFDKWEV